MNGLPASQLLRVGWGCACLLAPENVVRATIGAPADPFTRGFTRLLGARHLVQAALVGTRPSAPALAVGVLVDLSHAASDALWVLAGPVRLRFALTDAGLALSWAALGRVEARVADPGTRRAWPTRLLRLVPGGRVLTGYDVGRGGVGGGA